MAVYFDLVLENDVTETVIAESMKDIAMNAILWEKYSGLALAVRNALELALSMDVCVSMDSVYEIAGEVQHREDSRISDSSEPSATDDSNEGDSGAKPTSTWLNIAKSKAPANAKPASESGKVLAAVPRVKANSNTPKPKKIFGSTNDEKSFKSWLVSQAALIVSNGGLEFGLGNPYQLRDGTVSVPISILRSGKACRGTSFKFHYHPDAKGARVGHAGASKGHFKPGDGSNKGRHVRLFDYDVQGTIAESIYKQAMRRAKGRK